MGVPRGQRDCAVTGEAHTVTRYAACPSGRLSPRRAGP
ncbi:hypothetical protein F750_4375 [Streptomyces sp. PAMC 26508]|nr:hypothetical protein F750_4375 [Streptomyces sp. PAMC 26508]